MIAPGWYDDGTSAERWFDGVAWTEHVRAAPAPFAPAAQQSPQWAAPAVQPETRPGAPTWVAQAGAAPWAGQPAQPGAAPWAGQPGAAPWGAQPGNGPDEAMHWILPIGRSWQSIVAGYLGIFGLAIWPLAPFAVWLGIWAMRIPGGRGRGRAVFGIIAGALGTLFGLLAIVFWSA